jgi:hypothetical protein
VSVDAPSRIVVTRRAEIVIVASGKKKWPCSSSLVLSLFYAPARSRFILKILCGDVLMCSYKKFNSDKNMSSGRSAYGLLAGYYL